MKILFYIKNLILLLCFCAPNLAIAQVLFTQSFNDHSSETLMPYIGTGTNQFDHLAFSGSSTIRVANTTYPNQLRMFRSGTSIAFAKTTDLSPASDFLRIKFKIQVPAGVYNVTTAATFYVGSGFSSDATPPATANIHSRIGIGFFNTAQNSGTYVATQYLMRNMNSFNNSSELTGVQEITWYINHSGITQTYNNPAGGTSTIGNDKSDMWIGTNLEGSFDEMSAATATQPLTDFKFVFGQNGTLVIDDIEVSGPSGVVLPVSFTNFTAQKTGTTNQLTWATELEVNNKGYDVQRQNPTGAWETLGFVNGLGKATNYSFTDNTPLSISYYRLRQIDFDGKETFSKVVSVSQNTKGRISLAPNPTSNKVNIQFNQNDGTNQTTTIALFDMTGRRVLTHTTTADACQLDLSNLAKGMYLMKAQSDNVIFQEKIIRQ